MAALLVEANLAALRDEALLLTSELVANGVIHARSPLELEIVADAQGLQVTVTDFALPPASLMVTEITVANRSAGAGGRGLLLVSRFASRRERGGAGGRAVWFRPTSPTGPAIWMTPTNPTMSLPSPTRGCPDPLGARGQDMIEAVIGQTGLANLLDRLGRGLAAATATVSVDRRADPDRSPRPLRRAGGPADERGAHRGAGAKTRGAGLGQWCAVHLTNESGELSPPSLAHADEAAVPAPWRWLS